MAALGFLSAVWMLNLNRDYAKMNFDQVSGLAFGVIIGGILGARLFYVVQFWNDKYSRDWSAILRIDQGGLVYYGGFFMAMVVIDWGVMRMESVGMVSFTPSSVAEVRVMTISSMV